MVARFGILRIGFLMNTGMDLLSPDSLSPLSNKWMIEKTTIKFNKRHLGAEVSPSINNTIWKQ